MRHTKDERGHTYWQALPVEQGQVNISTTYPGQIRAFHLHRLKEDHVFVVQGQFLLVLGSDDPNEPAWTREHLGPGDSLAIPRNVWHGYQCVSPEPAVLVYWETERSGPTSTDDHARPADDYDGWV